MGVKQKTRTIEAMSKKELDEWLDDFNATHLGPPDEGSVVKDALIEKYRKGK